MGMSSLVGVVLCGGESKRMGRDKGLLTLTPGEAGAVHETEGAATRQTWASRALTLIESLGIPCVLSVNARQLDAYGDLFGIEKLVVDSGDVPGPLGGILSIHRRYPDKDLLPLACDMIRMDRETLTTLIRSYEETAADFYVYQLAGNDFAEPFPGIYRGEALERIGGSSLAGPQRLLKTGGLTHYIPTENADVFTNVNSL